MLVFFVLSSSFLLSPARLTAALTPFFISINPISVPDEVNGSYSWRKPCWRDWATKKQHHQCWSLSLLTHPVVISLFYKDSYMVFCCFAFSNFRLVFYHVQTTPSTMRMNPLSCLVKNEIQYSTTIEAGEKSLLHRFSQYSKIVHINFTFARWTCWFVPVISMRYMSEFLHQEVPKTGTSIPAYYRRALLVGETVLACYFLISIALFCLTTRGHGQEPCQ